MVVCFSVVGCSKTEGENKSENGNVEVVSDDQVEDQTDDFWNEVTKSHINNGRICTYVYYLIA